MVKIENTELEYTEAEGIALDYFLGGRAETKEQFAKRITDKCQEYIDTDKKGHDNQGMSSCYARCCNSLWEEQKKVRRKNFVKDFMGTDEEKTDKEIIAFAKDNPSYQTRTQRDAAIKAERVKEHNDQIKKTNDEINVLRNNGMGDDVIKVLYPKAVGII